MTARQVRNEQGDSPLALAVRQPMSNADGNMIHWSIPNALAGAELELGLYDVSGRKVMAVSKGLAVAGTHSETIAGSRAEPRLRSGVYFARLRIRNHVLGSTVLVIR